MEITGTNAFNVQTNFGSYRPLREDRDYASKRLWDNTDDYNNLQVFLKGEGLWIKKQGSFNSSLPSKRYDWRSSEWKFPYW